MILKSPFAVASRGFRSSTILGESISSELFRSLGLHDFDSNPVGRNPFENLRGMSWFIPSYGLMEKDKKKRS